MPGILGHPDRNFSKNFFIANWEKIIICPKRVSVGGSNPPNIEIHSSPSCICPGPISGRGRIFEKSHLWGPKLDFSQIGQMCPGDLKMVSRCSLRLHWPPPNVVWIHITLGEIWIFDNFGRFWPFLGNPQIWPVPPLYSAGVFDPYEKCHQSTSDLRIHGGAAKVLGGRDLTTYSGAWWMVSHENEFWFWWISNWANSLRILFKIKICPNP